MWTILLNAVHAKKSHYRSIFSDTDCETPRHFVCEINRGEAEPDLQSRSSALEYRKAKKKKKKTTAKPKTTKAKKTTKKVTKKVTLKKKKATAAKKKATTAKAKAATTKKPAVKKTTALKQSKEMKKFNPDGFALFGRAGRDRNSDEQRSNEQGPIQGSRERSSEEVDDLGQAERAFQKAAMELLGKLASS